MRHINTTSLQINRQSGAALVVALILLVALSLMAISSMNTASLDLIMAGNEQYRNRSFVSSEAGIENALRYGTFDSSNDYTLPTPASVGSGSDSYTYTITRPNNGVLETAPGTNSMDQDGVKAITFRITSTGGSERGTTAVHGQDLYKIVRASDGPAYNASCGTAGLDSAISTC